MRGPYERLKYDFRRTWECPKCQRREKTDFTTTSCFCQCRVKEEGNPVVCMALVEDGVRRVLGPVSRPRPEPPPHERPTPEEEGGGREEGRGGEGRRKEPYGKPKFEKRGRGGEPPRSPEEPASAPPPSEAPTEPASVLPESILELPGYVAAAPPAAELPSAEPPAASAESETPPVIPDTRTTSDGSS